MSSRPLGVNPSYPTFGQTALLEIPFSYWCKLVTNFTRVATKLSPLARRYKIISSQKNPQNCQERSRDFPGHNAILNSLSICSFLACKYLIYMNLHNLYDFTSKLQLLYSVIICFSVLPPASACFPKKRTVFSNLLKQSL
jgi:hypothetical protein